MISTTFLLAVRVSSNDRKTIIGGSSEDISKSIRFSSFPANFLFDVMLHKSKLFPLETGTRLLFFVAFAKTPWLLFAGHLHVRVRCFPIRRTFDTERRLNIFIQSVCGPGSRYIWHSRSATVERRFLRATHSQKCNLAVFQSQSARAIHCPRMLNKIQFSTGGPFRECLHFCATDFKSRESKSSEHSFRFIEALILVYYKHE